MKVAEIMETDVRTVAIDTPVSDVLVSLADGQVTGLPVVDTRNRVIGVVSSTDVIAAQAETRDARRAADSVGRDAGARHHDAETPSDRIDR